MMKRKSIIRACKSVLFASTAMLICLFSASPSTVFALTPLPDRRPEFFAGEWVGIGPSATHCRLRLDISGRGQLRLRQMNGTTVDVKIEKWTNQNQTLQITSSSIAIEVKNQMNGAFAITTGGFNCQMARANDFDRFLKTK